VTTSRGIWPGHVCRSPRRARPVRGAGSARYVVARGVIKGPSGHRCEPFDALAASLRCEHGQARRRPSAPTRPGRHRSDKWPETGDAVDVRRDAAQKPRLSVVGADGGMGPGRCAGPLVRFQRVTTAGLPRRGGHRAVSELRTVPDVTEQPIGCASPRRGAPGPCTPEMGCSSSMRASTRHGKSVIAPPRARRKASSSRPRGLIFFTSAMAAA
jgi:hypothetical protein